MIYRVLTTDGLGAVRSLSFYDDAGEAEARAQECRAEGMEAAVDKGAKDDSGTFVPE